MKKFIFFILIALSFSSCISYNYYANNSPDIFTCTFNDSYPIYAAEDLDNVAFVTSSNIVYLGQKLENNYWAIRYDTIIGYIKKPKFKTKNKVSKKDKDYLDFGYNGYYVDRSKKRSSSYSPNLGSYSSGGSVSVKGYYRKDGTYVKPHTRKAPSKSSYKSSRRGRR